MMTCILDNADEFERYKKLILDNTISIKREDLPGEFGENAFETVNEFIKKTRNLDYECVMYFDYITGEILQFAMGGLNNVKLTFDKHVFESHNVASIHNHLKNVLSPPSGKNFGILLRDFEDYELIAGYNAFWILKAKGVYPKLIKSIKIFAEGLFWIIFDDSGYYADLDYINDDGENIYGEELQKGINNINIDDLKLFKREYD